VGGHCIAVDPWFIVDAAPEVTPLIRTARAVNDAQPSHVADLIEAAVAGIPSPVIALLGMAYKADTDDVRESPAIEIATHLENRGFRVRRHDAHAARLPDGTSLERDLAAVANGADAIAILTDHTVYQALLPEDPALANLRQRIVIDARGCLRAAAWREAGYAVHQLGTPVAATAVGARA
jgi:UDP-N-acetyl-D-mannosaminuronic acid dehydrogenase